MRTLSAALAVLLLGAEAFASSPAMPAVRAAAASPRTAALCRARDDAERLRVRTPKLASRTRYFALWHIPTAARPAWRGKILKTWANCLSRQVEFGEFREVGDDVLAVVLDDFAWDAAVWEKQAKAEPFLLYQKYFPADANTYAGWYPQPLPGPAEAAYRALQDATGSKVPIVLADWWLFYSSRQVNLDNKEYGFGYYDWLGIKDQAAFEALRFVDRKKAIKIGDELRAALEAGRSRVAQLDRLIEQYSTYGDGDFWFTNDVASTAKGNTAPGNLKEGEFKPDAHEGYISLPNEFWGFWAGDAKGKRQATVPDTIATIDRHRAPLHQGNDTRIHAGHSCLHCHVNGGMQDIDDWARRTLRPPLQLDSDNYEDFLRLKKQYFRSLDERLQRGRKRYSAALDRCVSGLTPYEFARAHAEAYYSYLRPRTGADVAVLLGVSEECLLLALRRFFDPANVAEAETKKRLAIFENLIARQPDTVPTAHLEQFFFEVNRIVLKYGVHP